MSIVLSPGITEKIFSYLENPVYIIEQLDPMQTNIKTIVNYGGHTDYLDRHILYLESKMNPSNEYCPYMCRYIILCENILINSPKYYLFTDKKYSHRNEFLRTKCPAFSDMPYISLLSANKYAADYLRENPDIINIDLLAGNSSAVDLFERKCYGLSGTYNLINNKNAIHLLPDIQKSCIVGISALVYHEALDEIPDEILCPLIEKDINNSKLLCKNPKVRKWLEKYPDIYNDIYISANPEFANVAERSIIAAEPELKEMISNRRLLNGDKKRAKKLISSAKEKIKSDSSLLILDWIPVTSHTIDVAISCVCKYYLKHTWSLKRHLNGAIYTYCCDEEKLFLPDERACQNIYISAANSFRKLFRERQ